MVVYRCENCSTLSYSAAVLRCEVCGSDIFRDENPSSAHSESTLVEATNSSLEAPELREEIPNPDVDRIFSQREVSELDWNRFNFLPVGPTSSEYRSNQNVDTIGDFSQSITNYSLDSTIPTEESSNRVNGMSNMSPCNDFNFFPDGSVVSDYYPNSQYADTNSNSAQNITHSSFDPNKAGEINQNLEICRILNQCDKNILSGNNFISPPETSTSDENQSQYAEKVSNRSQTLLKELEQLLQYYRLDLTEMNTLFPDIPNTSDPTYSLDFQYDESANHLISLNSNFPHPNELLNQPSSTEPEIQLNNEAIDQIRRVIELSLAQNQEWPIDSAGPSTKNICRSQPVPEYFHHITTTLDTSDNSFTDLYSREGNSGGNFRNIGESPQQSVHYSKQQKEAESEQNCPTLCELLAKISAPPTIKKVYRCEVCKRKFTNESLFHRHIQNHKEKPYKCDQCPKEFKYEKELSYHSPVHSNERPFECKYCNGTFKWKSNLNFHIKKYHKSKRESKLSNEK